MQACLASPRCCSSSVVARRTKMATHVCRAGDNHVSAAHNSPQMAPQPPIDWDEIPVMSIDAETARQTLASVDDIYSTPTRPAQAAVPAMQQEDCHNASSLHVWSASYCDSESARNSMESTDMYLSD